MTDRRPQFFEELLIEIKDNGPSCSYVRAVHDYLKGTDATFASFDHLNACRCLMRLCVKDEACASEVFESDEICEYLSQGLREREDVVRCKNTLYVMINAMQCATKFVKTHIVEVIVMDPHFKDLPRTVPAVRPVLAKLIALSMRSAESVNKQRDYEAEGRCLHLVNSYDYVQHFFGALLLWTREWTLEEEDEARADVECIVERVVDAECFPTMFRNLHEKQEANARRKEVLLREYLFKDFGGDATACFAKVEKMVPVLFCDAQSTLLHFLGRLSVKTHRFDGKTVNDKHPYVLPESVLAFLLDTTREAAKVCKKYAKNDDAGFAERNVLRECLFTLRSISEIESTPHVPDTVGFLAGTGLARLLVGMSIALDPPSGSRQSMKAKGPAKAEEIPKFPIDDKAFGGQNFVRDNFPTVKPYNGYRVDIIATLANASHRRPRVCEDVRKLGGVAVVLSHTRGEEGDDGAMDGCEEEPFLREWALWGTRNLCEADDVIRKEIEVLAPEKILEAEELMKRGLKAELNPETGKPRVVSIEKSSKVEMETVSALGGSPMATRATKKVRRVETQKNEDDRKEVREEEEEFQIPKNWKVAEL